ncbi:hypothetical protein HDU92_007631 [Lobulomyces angularis]|nr:hypothetical protein HDU92_007631 [Lobulomyces angularis]
MHNFDLESFQKSCILRQRELARRRVSEDCFGFILDDLEYTLKFVGGCDLSFFPDDSDSAIACLVVLAYPSLQVVYKKIEKVKLEIPYISGFLAFREEKHISKLLMDLKMENIQIYPQLLFVDGNGTLHKEKFGVACHIGVVNDIPTIGCGKKLLGKINMDEIIIEKPINTVIPEEGIDLNYIKEREDELTKVGNFIFLKGKKDSFVYGSAVKSSLSKNCQFISPGHRVSNVTAVQLTLKLSKYRVVEPIRQADLLSREAIRKMSQD